MPVRENEYCLLEIPKGTAELGLRVTAVPEMKGVSENTNLMMCIPHTQLPPLCEACLSDPLCEDQVYSHALK